MILNEFGQPSITPSRFAHAADRSRVRGPQYWTRSTSIDELIPPCDRATLVSLSQRLYVNQGIVGATIDQKAEYSVGDAFLPEYGGLDEDAGNEVESWLRNVWFPNCDIRGGIHDWHQLLINASIAIDHGDSFTLLTETNEGGFPMLQNIASYRVRSEGYGKMMKVESGQFKGAKIHDGIIYNKNGRAIGYRVYGDAGNEDKDDFTDVPARSMIHLYNPRFPGQGRGLPSFVRGLEDLKHCLQSTEDERRRQAIISGLGLIVTNEVGGPDLNDPAYALGTGEGCAASKPVYENTKGVYYLTANQGEKLEQIKHDSPGELYESFHDRMIRMALIGSGWAYSLVWKPAGQGTAERAEVLRARRAVSARQNLLRYLARRAVSYAVSYGIENNLIPALKSPMIWGFSKPPRLSVDDGREASAMRDDFRMGAINLSDIHEANGTSEEKHLKDRLATLKRQKMETFRVNEELEKINPAIPKIEAREIVMLTPNEMSQATTKPNSNEDDSDREQSGDS